LLLTLNPLELQQRLEQQSQLLLHLLPLQNLQLRRVQPRAAQETQRQINFGKNASSLLQMFTYTEIKIDLFVRLCAKQNVLIDSQLLLNRVYFQRNLLQPPPRP
jgi:hypothetical protein